MLKRCGVLAVAGLLAAAVAVPAEAQKRVTELFWADLESIRASAPYMTAVTLEFAAQKANMEFHPGAVKYYKEAGIWKE